MMTLDGQPICADVHLTEDDAELLHRFLGRYLAKLRAHPRGNVSRLEGDNS